MVPLDDCKQSSAGQWSSYFLTAKILFLIPLFAPAMRWFARITMPDYLNLIGHGAALIERFQDHLLQTRQGPTPELAINARPFA